MGTYGDNHVWLGHNPVQPETNRVVIHERVVLADLAKTQDDLYWGVIDDEQRAIASRFKQPLETVPYARKIDNNNIQQNRDVTIPKPFFPDFEGKTPYAQPLPDQLQFDYGETLHFLTTDTLYRHGLFYVLNDKDGRNIVNEMFGDNGLIPDGGQDLRGEQEEYIIPEAKLPDTTIDMWYVEEQRELTDHELSKLAFRDHNKFDNIFDELVSSENHPDDFPTYADLVRHALLEDYES